MLWNLECPVGLSLREICARFNEGNVWHNLDGPPKNKELWSYVVKFEFSRPKSSSDVPISSNGSFIYIHRPIILQTAYYIPRPVVHQMWSTGWNEK